MQESSGSYTAQNPANYLGMYQLGEAALIDVGYVNADGDAFDNDYSGGWTGRNGVNSLSDFLNTPVAQELAVRELHQQYWQTLKSLGLDDYVGTSINGIQITESGLIAGSHLVGPGDVKVFLESNGGTDPEDGNSTPVSSYIDDFGGYDLVPPIPQHKPDVPNAEAEELDNLQPGTGDSDATDTDTYADDVEDTKGNSEDVGSPLVLDMDGDGIELTNIASADSVYWDYDNDGFAEGGGWVDTDDGLLAVDTNEDGIINNSTELFGDQSGYANGFLALAAYDSNGDGLITSEDSEWADLRVWIDANTNGYSESTELHTLDSKSITEIDLGYSDTSSTIAGNEILQESTFTINGNTNDLVDAYFAFSDLNTVYNRDFVLDYRTADLPTARGYGEIPALHIAISLDNDDQDPDSLLSLVTDLNDLSFADLFDETADLVGDVTDIMYRWAGVDDVAPGSRGSLIDARKLEFLEAFTGEPFLQRGVHSDPYGVEAAGLLEEAFAIALDNIYARLLMQAAGGELFTGDFYYDLASDSIVGVTGLDSTQLAALETEVTGLSSTGEREVFWGNVVRMIENAVGTTNLPGADQTALDDAITASDATLDLQDILDSITFTHPTGVTEGGTTGNDTLSGSSGNDELNADDGDDTLNGLAGDDELNGGTGDDVLNGDAGADYLRGGGGGDIYNWSAGDGEDTIRETGSGTDDRIVLGSGFDVNDLTITRVGNSDLVIDIDNGTDTGRIVIENQFNYATGGDHVELIEFDDSSTYDLDDQHYTLTGTAGADTLYGVSSGGLTNDTLYGLAGNDELYGGYAGDDTLYGGDGNDKLVGNAGADTLEGGNGDDDLDGGADNDTLAGGAGDDVLDGGGGVDTFIYLSGHDTVIDGSSASDEIVLDATWDSATPDYFKIGNDLQIYWDADNTITIRNHYTTGEVTTMVYDDTTSVDLTAITAQSQGTSGNDTISASSGDDIIYGFEGDDEIYGNSGNDIEYGGPGNDQLRGGYGDDYLAGGAGDDDLEGKGDNDHYYYLSGHDDIFDGRGSEILELDASWEWDDLTFARYDSSPSHLVIEINDSNSIQISKMFYSGSQVETLRMNDGTGDVNLLMMDYTTHGDSGNNSISGIGNGNFNGGVVNDTMYGYAGNDTITGYQGDDILYGGEGDDSLNGRNGNDYLDGGADDDTLNGHGDDDTYIFYAGGGLDSIIDTAGGTDQLWITGGLTINDISVSDYGSDEAKLVINSGVDEIIINNLRNGNASRHVETVRFDDGFEADLPSYNSWLNGGSGNDLVAGNGNDNTMIGFAGDDDMDAGGGADAVHGGTGADDIHGDGGDDLLHGGAGDDMLYGDDGLDTLFGGDGADTFSFDDASAFNDIDVIKDFDVSTDHDVIDLVDVLAATSYDPQQDAITDWVELTTVGSDTAVKIDRDGTGGTYGFDQVAKLEGVSGLTDEAALVSSGNLLAA